jgi:deoxyribonuclease-4
LYDMVAEARLFTDLSEEQINHRLIAWFASKHIM